MYLTCQRIWFLTIGLKMPKMMGGSTGQILSLISLVPSLIPLFVSPHQSLKSCRQTQERMNLFLPYIFEVLASMALITSPTKHKYILHAKSLPRVSLLYKDWERSKSSERLSGLPSTECERPENPEILSPWGQDGMVGGMTKLWWRHQGGFKVRAVTLLSPPGKYRPRK